MKKKAAALLFAALLLLHACGSPPPPEPAGPPIAQHVLIISIDGARPDVLLRAQLDAATRGIKSNIHQLMTEGSFTFWARTIPASITLPSHTSMLTGVGAETHGITWNVDLPEDRIVYPKVQTLFEIAKRKGLTTSMFAAKDKFTTLGRPGSIDWSYINRRDSGVDDPTLAGIAADAIRQHKPNVTFLHLANTDVVGHRRADFWEPEERGWGSPAQIASLQEADYCVGLVVQALKDANIYDSTLIIVTADHGGAGGSHGPNDPRSRHIPWICVGPQVKQHYDLTRNRSLVVYTEDTFATACFFLGLPLPRDIIGKPIKEVIRERELLHDID